MNKLYDQDEYELAAEYDPSGKQAVRGRFYSSPRLSMRGDTRSGLAIRPASAADAETVARIYVDSWNVSFGELLSRTDRTVTPDLVARWRRALDRPVPHRWWVAERAGTIVGCVGIGPSRDPVDPSIGELDSIFVDEPHWRKGVGSALIAVAHRHLLQDGYRTWILWTVSGYRQGIAFYEAMGWRRDGGVRDDGRQIRFRRDPMIVRGPADRSGSGSG